MSKGGILPPTVESLYQLARELDVVPVGAQRLLRLQAIIAATCAQNEDGVWLHASGEQFRVKDTTWTIGLKQGDINTLTKVIRRRACPEYFLLTPESLSDCEEILDAKILSFEHTDPVREKIRQKAAAERGVPYLPPVGEGVMETDRKIEHNLNDVGALNAAVSGRGKGRKADLVPIQVADDSGMLFRPVADILNDMTHGERGVYKRFRKDKLFRSSSGQEYAKKLAADTIRDARERGTEGLWQGNLRWQLRECVRAQDEIFGKYRYLKSRRQIHYNPYTGLSSRDDSGYLRYPPNGYDLDSPAGEGAGPTVQRAGSLWTGSSQETLCWVQLRTLARMHLHNQLLDLHHEGKLPGTEIAGYAQRIDHPGSETIARVHGGSYLDFLQEVSQRGSEGLLRGEPGNNPGIAKSAAEHRIEEIEYSMVITENIRQMVPKWFVRRLIDRNRLRPSPLHGHAERITGVE